MFFLSLGFSTVILALPLRRLVLVTRDIFRFDDRCVVIVEQSGEKRRVPDPTRPGNLLGASSRRIWSDAPPSGHFLLPKPARNSRGDTGDERKESHFHSSAIISLIFLVSFDRFGNLDHLSAFARRSVKCRCHQRYLLDSPTLVRVVSTSRGCRMRTHR